MRVSPVKSPMSTPTNSLIEAGIRTANSIEVRRNDRILVGGARKVVRETAAREVSRHLRIHSSGAADGGDKGAS